MPVTIIKQDLRRIARREVAAAMKRATALDGEARRDKCLAPMLPAPDAARAWRQAADKAQRAMRLRQIAARLAAVYHIKYENGRG